MVLLYKNDFSQKIEAKFWDASIILNSIAVLKNLSSQKLERLE